VNVQQIIAECRTLDELNRTKEAVRLLSDSIESEPSHELHYERGVRREILGEYSAARDDLTAAIRLEPKKAKYWIARGRLLCERLNLYSEAEDNFLVARVLDRTSAIPYQHLSMCYLQLNRYQDAVKQAEIATTLAPNDAMSFFCLGQSELFKERISEAIRHLKHAVEIDSTVSLYWSALARGYVKIGDLPNAKVCYEKAIELDKSVDSLIGLAQVELKAGNPQEAIIILESVGGMELNETQRVLVEGYLKLASSENDE